jgi:hypothetical protein
VNVRDPETEMDDKDRAEYDLMLELDQLETLKEEMEELSVSSLAEVIARMEDLHRKLDDLEPTP